MVSPYDLTTLNNVKAWWQQASGGQGVVSQDDLIAMEITRVSSMIMGWMDRGNILPQTYTDIYSGMGGQQLMLLMYPVISVSSLVVSNINITPGPANAPTPLPFVGSAGYYLEPWNGQPPGRRQALSLVGAQFYRGYNNITVQYQAGFLQKEAVTVPASGPFHVYPSSPWGMLASDAGVTYANGTALTAVAANPTAGQYVAPKPFATQPQNFWQFSAADANQILNLSYGYIPQTIEGAACELVCERLSYRQRIGQSSKSLGGQETASYQLTDLPLWVKSSLQPYKRVPSVI